MLDSRYWICSRAQSVQRSNILRSFGRGDRFHAHGQERTKEQNGGAPKLSLSQSFTINPIREAQSECRAKEMKRLRERHADFTNGDVVQDVRQRNAGHSRDDQNEVYLRSGMKWCGNFPKRECKRK